MVLRELCQTTITSHALVNDTLVPVKISPRESNSDGLKRHVCLEAIQDGLFRRMGRLQIRHAEVERLESRMRLHSGRDGHYLYIGSPGSLGS